MTQVVPVVDLSGPPHERGRLHGELLRDEIRECIDVYRLVLGRSDDGLRAASVELRAALERFSPSLSAEIEGIALGASVPRWWIDVLNGRSELMAAAGDGCTAMYVPGLGLLGQTWDWLEVMEPLVVALRVEDQAGRRLLTVTEPGIVGKIGCNDAGIGVCLNFLYAPGPHRGVPVHPLLREVLTTRSIEEAARVVARARSGRAANVLVGSAEGAGLNVAFTGATSTLEPVADAPVVRTNHVIDQPGTAGGLHDNSCARLAIAQERVGSVVDEDSFQAVLDDQSHPVHPICAPYQPYLGVRMGTTATVVMDLRRRQLRVRLGPNPGTATQLIEV